VTTADNRGRLTVVATPIGNLGDLSPRAEQALRDADVIACEDTRHTRKLLSHAGIPAGNRLVALHEHNEAGAARQVLSLLDAGRNVALVSDAGTPGISDPGERVVRLAAAAGVEVTTIPGPSVAIAALVVSGMATDRFVFEGFLPRKGSERSARLRELAAERRTAVVYESPHRVRATVADLAEACGPLRRIAVCRELTKLHEEVWRGSLHDAVVHLDERDPRGEYVLVLDAAPAPAAATSDDVTSALREHLAAGDDKKTAVAAVAAELGVPKRQVYDAALALAGRENASGPAPGDR
jgi:16S rRNA (cytidine1402-2'-O)-methyltransferase